MRGLRAHINEHRHFLIVVALLTLLMTFPTIVYLFRTDGIYLPSSGSYDMFIHLWDVWYWKQILTGAADRAYTTIMFYPEGVSLTHHPFASMPANTLQIGLQAFMPAANAFNLTYLLVVLSNAAAAYVYALWLFKDKWIALFAAVVFGFSPHILGQPFSLHDITLASVALSFYCLHRGLAEKRPLLVVASGLLAGLTSTITLYSFSCLMISLAACALAFGLRQWRERRFWRDLALLALSVGFSSVWIVYPMMADGQSLESALEWHGGESGNDLMSAFVNHNNPFFGAILDPALESLRQPEDVFPRSKTSYVGFTPLVLLCLGLYDRDTRRRMLPWLALGAFFFVLRLGSTLVINGTVYPNIPLPKATLNDIFPAVFKAFSGASRFQVGLLLPLGALAGYGLLALRARQGTFAFSRLVLILIVILALEYYVPVVERSFSLDRFAYMDWLEREDQDEIRLIHLPMGRTNSKQYMLFQSLSGYPHAEGAISRTPDAAFDYIRANPVMNRWNDLRPTNCVIDDRDDYLAAAAQLSADGFSHVVHHRDGYFWERYIESFRYVDPAYSDDYVDIYRLEDFLDSCPD